MTSDHLADVLDVVRVRATLSGAIAVNSRWTCRASLCDQLKIIGVLRGHVTIRTNGAPPAALEADDVAVLHARSWLELHGGTGTGPVLEVAAPRGYVRHLEPAGFPSDVVVGGHIDLDDTGRALLTEVLPSLGHLRGSLPQTGSMRRSLRLLFEESAEERAGSSFARRQYGRLLLLEILRTYASASELPPGWLRAQADDRLRPALAAMHADPGKPWRLHDLAGTARMSRTAFAVRFRAAAGVPPHAYLTRWRMLLARRALAHDDVTVAALATQLGYGSESSFSHAFKREVGESPLRYRTRGEYQD
ncbi:AraC family transcriptional regulator [Streptomyces tendae]|uniref:AraC family transcriptional regulator n=1 Tax=Streptomyces tendae TaxID=1932 RepID=UPI003444E593